MYTHHFHHPVASLDQPVLAGLGHRWRSPRICQNFGAESETFIGCEFELGTWVVLAMAPRWQKLKPLDSPKESQVLKKLKTCTVDICRFRFISGTLRRRRIGSHHALLNWVKRTEKELLSWWYLSKQRQTPLWRDLIYRFDWASRCQKKQITLRNRLRKWTNSNT